MERGYGSWIVLMELARRLLLLPAGQCLSLFRSESLTRTHTPHAPLRLLRDAHAAARQKELADGGVERENVDAIAKGEDELGRGAVWGWGGVG